MPRIRDEVASQLSDNERSEIERIREYANNMKQQLANGALLTDEKNKVLSKILRFEETGLQSLESCYLKTEIFFDLVDHGFKIEDAVSHLDDGLKIPHIAALLGYNRILAHPLITKKMLNEPADGISVLAWAVIGLCTLHTPQNINPYASQTIALLALRDGGDNIHFNTVLGKLEQEATHNERLRDALDQLYSTNNLYNPIAIGIKARECDPLTISELKELKKEIPASVHVHIKTGADQAKAAIGLALFAKKIEQEFIGEQGYTKGAVIGMFGMEESKTEQILPVGPASLIAEFLTAKDGARVTGVNRSAASMAAKIRDQRLEAAASGEVKQV